MSTTSDKYDFGMIGLGTMGRNLLLNMGDHGVKGRGLIHYYARGINSSSRSRALWTVPIQESLPKCERRDRARS